MTPALLLLALALAPPPELSDAERGLLDAARAGDAVRVRRLIETGARVEVRDEHGFTPLMRAAGSASAESVRLLIRAGAEVNAALHSGWTALMEATANGRLDSARLLLEAGARPNDRDRARGSALDLAERGGQLAIADLLRQRGARGSGRSVGDRVCVLRWEGAGFCGLVEARDAIRYRIRIDEVRGCELGCAADASCSEGREVRADSLATVGVSDLVWTLGSCLTHTGLE
ncbi:MAG TPA: ankyrin repeat domain-containing protein [Vicinamibacteria bacterium]|nr:ankyrin repeat domain-containing protein [Vicinamibacteria bacterium]